MKGRAGLALVLVAALPPAAAGQVTTNQNALDRLGTAHKPVVHHTHRAARGAHAAHAARAAHATTTAARIGPPPSMPLHPPAPPVIAPPPIHVDLHPPPPPPAIPVDAKAAGTVARIAGGLRLTFGPGSAAVNAQTDDALHEIATLMKQQPQSVTDIDAFAPGTADDPSTPRRLSLERALAARAVLIDDGIASTRIYARALGDDPAPPSDASSGAPPDRVDLIVRQTQGAQATGAHSAGAHAAGAQAVRAASK